MVAEGSGGAIGDYVNFNVSFSQGGYSLGTAQHVVSVGAHAAVALDTQTVPTAKLQRSRDRLAAAATANAPVLSDDVMGEILHAIGLGYFRLSDLSDEYLAGTQRML